MSSPTNAQKTPFARSLALVAQGVSDDGIQILGKCLPATVVSVSGNLVTVKFELDSIFTLPQVTVPVMGPEYIRYPLKAGDGGILVPCDASNANVSGQVDGTAKLTLQGNLGALSFFPISSKKWSATDDPNKLVLYGPDGAILRDAGKNAIVEVSATQAKISFGVGVSIVVDATGITFNGQVTFNNHVVGSGGTINFGASNLVTTGEVTANGIPLSTHKTLGVTIGGGTSGLPTP